MPQPSIDDALTDNQARLLTTLHHEHGTVIPDTKPCETAAENGTLGSLVSDGVLAQFDAEDLTLLEDLIDYHAAWDQPLFTDPTDVQRYEADLPSFTPERFARLHRRGALYEHGNITVPTGIGDDLLEYNGKKSVYTLTGQGRAMLNDAPLAYRHPAIFDAYTDLKQGGEPHDCIITISGGRATGTSSHAETLAESFDFAYSDSGAWYREAADALGMPVEMLRRNRKWVEHMEDRNFDIENDAHTYAVAGCGDPVVIEGRLAGAALAAARDDGRPIAPIRIRMTCDDADRAARYAVRENIAAAETPDNVTMTERNKALEQVRVEDAAIYDAFAETYGGIDPRRDIYYTHTVDNTGTYEAAQEALRHLLHDSGLLD